MTPSASNCCNTHTNTHTHAQLLLLPDSVSCSCRCCHCSCCSCKFNWNSHDANVAAHWVGQLRALLPLLPRCRCRCCLFVFFIILLMHYYYNSFLFFSHCISRSQLQPRQPVAISNAKVGKWRVRARQTMRARLAASAYVACIISRPRALSWVALRCVESHSSGEI